LKAIEQPIDTSTAAGKCFFDMLGVFAEFETNWQGIGLPIARSAKLKAVFRGSGPLFKPTRASALSASWVAITS
jgi:hypothetical protein